MDVSGIGFFGRRMVHMFCSVFSFVDGGVMRSDQIRMGLFFGFRLSFCLWVSAPLDFHGFVYLLMMGFRIYGG